MTTSSRRCRRPSTSTPGPSTSRARPWITSIPCCLTRPVSPPTSLSTILSSNAFTAGQSGSPDALMPHSSERFTVSMTAADCRRAFVGMQPRSRQVPPRRSSRFDEGDALAELRGAQGGGVPAGPGADHHYVVGITHPERKSTAVPSSVRLTPATAVGCRRMDGPQSQSSGIRRWSRAPTARREDRPVRRLEHADRVRGGARRAQGRARARGAVRSHASRARSRSPDRGRSGCCSMSSRTTCRRPRSGRRSTTSS